MRLLQVTYSYSESIFLTQLYPTVLMAASVAGTSYAFGIFSEIFKNRLGFSQVNLSLIGSFGSTGLYTGVFCGLAIEATGPKTGTLYTT